MTDTNAPSTVGAALLVALAFFAVVGVISKYINNRKN